VGRAVANLSRWGALSAAGLLVLGLAPYFPQHEYEARYILLAIANEVPNGTFHFIALDALTGEVDMGYIFKTRESPDSSTPHRGVLEIATGEWGPSRGPTSLLPNGYPAPFLQERQVQVEGGPFKVRLWEGVGVQKDCKARLTDVGLVPYRTTGGTQSWGPALAPPPGRASDHGLTLPQNYWDRPQYLTCAWIEFVGGPGAGAQGAAGVQVIAS
jgi:hypothetical protein